MLKFQSFRLLFSLIKRIFPVGWGFIVRLIRIQVEIEFVKIGGRFGRIGHFGWNWRSFWMN